MERAEPSWEKAGSLSWAWCGGAWSSAPHVPVEDYSTLFCLTCFCPPGSQAGGSQLPAAHCPTACPCPLALMQACGQSPQLSHSQHHHLEAAAPLSALLLVGLFWVLITLILGLWHVWAKCVLAGGQPRAGLRMVPESQHHIASPHRGYGPFPTLPQLRREAQGKVPDP